jgi:hypothetical protein
MMAVAWKTGRSASAGDKKKPARPVQSGGRLLSESNGKFDRNFRQHKAPDWASGAGVAYEM